MISLAIYLFGDAQPIYCSDNTGQAMQATNRNNQVSNWPLATTFIGSIGVVVAAAVSAKQMSVSKALALVGASVPVGVTGEYLLEQPNHIILGRVYRALGVRDTGTGNIDNPLGTPSFTREFIKAVDKTAKKV